METTAGNKLLKRRDWLLISSPAALVAVGYIDPGNWVTDIAGGSRAGYALLFVVLVSSVIAILFQRMSARLGFATGKDLAQLSKECWPRFAIPAWIVTELAIIATDLAEVLGSAIALQLLFGIPLLLGIILTIFDVFILLALNKSDSHLLEKLIISLLFIIVCGFIYELVLAKPMIREILKGFLPSARLVRDPQLLYLAIGVVGATVMPHNLYLHSSLVQVRWRNKDISNMSLIAIVDTCLLSAAMLLNSGLVILAASVFHYSGNLNIAEISEAYHLLAPLLGSSFAAILFGIMLLASGQSAAITGTLAGQIVMNGFLNLELKPWLRRLITRGFALIPAIIVVAFYGEHYAANLLVISQVFLSLQLPFAIIPLLFFTSNSKYMGTLVNGRWMYLAGYCSAAIIILANMLLLFQSCMAV
jgi:manganese transport protein